MKKSMHVVLVGLLLALSPLSGNAQVVGDSRTQVLSNELGAAGEGGLIDRLIAAGYGSQNLYQILQLLAAQPGSGIPADFVTEVGSHPGSDAFTTALSNFSSAFNNPLELELTDIS